jgi:predicted TIM-barrel fold metal-dependent hydrolase
MGMPTDVGAVDLMIAFPHADASVDDYTFRSLLRDEGSADMVFPVEYIFHDVPNHLEEGNDPIAVTLAEMDKAGVAIGLLGGLDGLSRRALAEHPDRFRPSIHVDPNDITGSVREIRQAHEEFGIRRSSRFRPAVFRKCPSVTGATTPCTRPVSTSTSR